jgi:L-histidine N-alpha-methyltransferase
MTRLHVERCLPEGYLDRALRADARAGLLASPKTLPPKWLYDERGSELFEKITQLDEYYPTRAERAILRSSAAEIAAASGAVSLVELGAGAADKTRLLLDALSEAGTLREYVPVDVSETALVEAAHRVLDSYLGLPDETGPRLVAFIGSTIGNMLPEQRAEFLGSLRSRLRPGDALLLGTDLVKDPAVLRAAYDDAAGVTAAFNKNVLLVLNAELGADFDPDQFDHIAAWDPDADWIEMRLRSLAAQSVSLPEIGLEVEFADGEEMRTEVSAKFRPSGVAAELAAAGFAMKSWWTNEGEQFGLSLSVPA